MRTTMYSGLQQGAAIRRNRYLREARQIRNELERYPFGLTYEAARGILERMGVEGAYLIANPVAFAFELLNKNLRWAIERARYHHRDWKVWSARNRQWRKEMAALDNFSPLD